VVFLLDTATALERRIRELDPPPSARRSRCGCIADAVSIPPSRGRRRGKGGLDALEVAISQGDDPLLAPLRVAWLPPRRPDGTRVVRLRDVPSAAIPSTRPRDASA
jgi:hypothetical protein